MMGPKRIQFKPQRFEIPEAFGGRWATNPAAFPAAAWEGQPPLGASGLAYSIGRLWKSPRIADTVNFLRAPNGIHFMTVDLQRYPPTQPFYLGIRRTMEGSKERLGLQWETATDATALFPPSASHVSRTNMASLFRNASGLGIRNESAAAIEVIWHVGEERTGQSLPSGEAITIAHGTTYCSVLASRIGFLLVRLPQNPQAFLPCDKNELGVRTAMLGPETIGPDPRPTMASVFARDRGT
ncbi:MAG: hypothetical protein HY543_02125, partial [Deltaproteobacteria bacterium]|nr:hypothetical protein [Deltaproteobacteria bacterium]